MSPTSLVECRHDAATVGEETCHRIWSKPRLGERRRSNEGRFEPWALAVHPVIGESNDAGLVQLLQYLYLPLNLGVSRPIQRDLADYGGSVCGAQCHRRWGADVSGG